MRLENDKVFNELYDEEFEKIPFLFRFSRKRCIIAFAVTGGLTVLMLILTTVLQSTAQTVLIDAMPGHDPFMINTFDRRVVAALIIVAVAVFLLTLWIVIAKWFEKRAFKKATNLANMIFLSERHRAELKWQDWKMENRDY